MSAIVASAEYKSELSVQSENNIENLESPQHIFSFWILMALMKYTVFLSIPFLLIFTSIMPAYAANTSGCQPIYGGGQTCTTTTQLTIDKKVKDPDTEDYVDSLSSTDPNFSPGDIVPFKITIQNTSKNDIRNITLHDLFPPYTTFQSGDGTFDTNTHTFTTTIDKLTAGTSRVLYLQGKVSESVNLPSGQSTVCVINQAIASTNELQAQDNAQYCIANAHAASTNSNTSTPTTGNTGFQSLRSSSSQQQTTKGGKPVYQPTQTKSTPATGPEDWAVFGLIPTGAAGYWLRRKTK